MVKALAFVLPYFACALALATETETGWIAKSNANAQPVLEVLAKYNPEAAARFGLEGHDEEVLDLRDNIYERSRGDIRRVLDQLREQLVDEQHPKVRQDLKIVTQVLTDNLARGERRRRLLPLKLLEKAVLEEFIPSVRTRDVDEAENDRLQQVRNTLTREIKKILDDTGIPSISIALIKGDRIVWRDAFGDSNVRMKIPATPDTVYSTGSCFKPITAMAVMQLVDAGKLKLDDPINKYLGEHSVQDKSADGKPVTVRHLLSHYSGLTTAPEAEGGGLGAESAPLWNRAPMKPLTELPSLLKAINDPGQTFRYSNYGYSLAGLIIENVSGQSYEDYIVDNIFEPLGIKERPIVPTPEMIERLALPYRLENNQPVPEHWHRLDVYPAGDAWLSVPAMSTILLSYLNGGSYNGSQILSKGSVEEMRRPQLGGRSGLDFGIRKHDGSTLIMHGGGVTGYTTKFILDVDAKVGVYVAANAHLQLVATRLLAQMSIDLLREKELGTGLVREVTAVGLLFARNQSGQWRIDGVVPGSSANQKGLSRGMVIQAINDVPISDKPLRECIQMANGPVGKEARLTLVDSKGQTRTVKLTNQRILAPS